KQLMDIMMPIKDFPDCFNYYRLNAPDVKIKVLFPFPIRHMWIDSVRDEGVSGLKANLLNYFQEKRLFPFWNFIRWRRRRVNDKHITGLLSVEGKKVKNLYAKDVDGKSIISRL
ncbi:MAG: hypothetical protein AAFN93_25825, partial [Bacteroidota bacterium]